MLSKSSGRPSEDELEELLAHLGGAEALRDDPNDFRKAVNRLWTERELLIENHPERWVSMGKEGVAAIGDSIEEKLSENTTRAEDAGIPVVALLASANQSLIRHDVRLSATFPGRRERRTAFRRFSRPLPVTPSEYLMQEPEVSNREQARRHYHTFQSFPSPSLRLSFISL